MKKIAFLIMVLLNRCVSTDSKQQENISYNSNTANDDRGASRNQAESVNKKTDGNSKDIIDNEYSANAALQNVAQMPEKTNTTQNAAGINSLPAEAVPSNSVPSNNSAVLPNLKATTSTKVEEKNSPAVPIEISGKPFSQLKYIAYDFQRSKKNLEVTLHLDGSNEYSLLMEKNLAGQKELVVRFPNADCPAILKRHLDSEEFSSPVSYVRTRKRAKEQYLDVILTLRDDIEPRINASPHLVVLKFDVPVRYFNPNLKTASIKAKVEKAQILENPTTGSLGTKANQVAKEPAQSNETMEWLPKKNVELKGVEIPSPKQLEPVKIQKTAPVSVNKKLVPGPTIPAAGVPAPPIPAAPIPVMRQMNPQNIPQNLPPRAPQPGGPQNLKFKDLDDGGFEEKDKTHSEEEKFEVRATGRIFSVAQELFDSPTSNGGMDLIASPSSAELQEDIPGDEVGKKSAPASQRKAIKIDFRGAPLSEVVRALTAETKINFIIPSDIGKTAVNLTLRDVPWDVALKALLESNNLGMQEMGPNLVRIDNFRKFAEDKRQLEDAKRSVERLIPTKVLVIRLSYAKASQVAGTVDKFLEAVKSDDKRTKVQFDDRTNSLIVEATPVQLAKVKVLVERIDLQTPQVRISSRILEVTKTFKNTLGIAWGSPLNFDQGRGLGFGGLPFPNNLTSDFSFDSGLSTKVVNSSVNLGSINNSVALKFKISAEESKGTTEILQNQTIMVQDNEEANIDAGLEDVFVIQGSQTSPGSLQSVKYLLTLKVTPRITADGSVQMKLNIASDSPFKSATNATAGKQSRAIATTLLRKSGETAVIGGLYTSQKALTQTGVPFLMDLPLLGALFRGTEKSENQRELMILITPAIVNSSNTYLDAPASNDKLSSNIPQVTETKVPEENSKNNSTRPPDSKSSNVKLSNSSAADATLNSNSKNTNSEESL